MGSVRTVEGVRFGGVASACATTAPGPSCGPPVPTIFGVFVLDIAYVLGVIGLFALVGLIAKAVEKL